MTDDPARPLLRLSAPRDGAAPLQLGQRVTLYVCGITPYDAAHLGHAFTYAVFDTLVRFLRDRGYQVLYCQNVTDVDDDVLRRAVRNGEDYLELGRRETAAYLREMDALGIIRPTWLPRATQEIPAMVELASELQSAGSLYEVDGTLFFDVTTFPGFGDLSGLDEDTQRKLLAERGGDPEDPRKRHPLDFVVWQRAAHGEPSWESPWGLGRPGWHLECSAMSRRHLGVTIDLHGGGADLLYPHHESERAQSETANGVPFVRRWLHTGMVRHEGEKMSKSLGNLVFAHDLAREHEPAAVRLALLSHHYRGSWEFDPGELKEAAERLDGWRRAARGASLGSPLPEPVDAALAHDLDTPAALAEIDALAAAGEGAAVRAAAAVLGVALKPAD
ncbi:MAG TPA: cysteine--tRNA ligase [Actinomycetes bacterium]|jgi:L-cysteine:1D-myo-inositol 2-amino-2-deoxy-alpha-D-glucopyranoside ligase|nr:cysteine--tRNA ligase [Actinomycetes bacterium]